MGKMKINTRLERQKLLKPKQSSINLEKLKEKRTEFQLELKNRFQLLTDKCTDEEGNRSLETWTDLLVEKTQETAIKIAGKKPKTCENKISESTRKLMEKRRNMKAEGIGIQNVEYVETCKTVRKKLREYIRSYKATMIKSTIEENRSLNKNLQETSTWKTENHKPPRQQWTRNHRSGPDTSKN